MFYMHYRVHASVAHVVILGEAVRRVRKDDRVIAMTETIEDMNHNEKIIV